MKIYQVHEYSGEYEYFQDRIVGSYLYEKRAISKKEELEQIENERRKKSEHCGSCPIDDSDVIADEFDVVVKRCSIYCKDAKITEDRFGYDCENYCSYWDEVTYEIKEIEVEE